MMKPYPILLAGLNLLLAASSAYGQSAEAPTVPDAAESESEPAMAVKESPAGSSERVLAFVSPPDMSPVPVRDILSALQREATKLTQYGGPKNTADKSGVTDISGLTLTTGTDGMTFTYVRGSKKGSDEERATRATSKIVWIIKEEGTQVSVILSAPTPLQVEQGKASMFSKIEPLDKPDKLAADVQRVYSNLRGAIQRSVLVYDDADVDYDEKAIYANFERILGKYVPVSNDPATRGFDANRGSNYYKLRRGDTIQPVQVMIYPYREKSKAHFEFFYTYYVFGDGTGTYSAQDVQGLRDKLSAIARD